MNLGSSINCSPKQLAQRIEAEKQRRADERKGQTVAAPLRLLDFAANFLKAEAGGQNVPLRPACAFHEELCRTLEAMPGRRPIKEAWLAPRGFAKSSYVSYAFPLWAACERLEPYVLIISESDPLATKMLRNIRRQLERNRPLLERYPDAGKGALWQYNILELLNGCVIQCAGTGAAIRGVREGETRPTVIIADDLQKKEHVYSELQRERDWDWWQSDIMPLGSPRTNMFVVGTALHRDCIACKLQGATGWNSKTFKSITTMPARMDLWTQWENILHERRTEDGEHATERAAERALAFFEANRVEMEK